MLRILLCVFAVALAIRLIAPTVIDRQMNLVQPHEPYRVSAQARQLHQQLTITDWHADSLLWNRDFMRLQQAGHLDWPRAMEGNLALQVFTTVTKSPSGLNNVKNSADSFDQITPLIVAQGWPPRTWTSLKERALYQAERLHEVVRQYPDQLHFVASQADLESGLKRRQNGEQVLLAMLGTEGSHALDGELSAVDELFLAGFRVFGLQHFFDNRLGGSLHGESKQGLTEFGRAVVKHANQLGIIIDVAHSSEAVVRDVLQLSTQPVVLSHTGFKGQCDSPRNISDELLQRITSAGGLVGVGFWDSAVCDFSPAGVASAIVYGIELLGVEHVSLGSDFDGTVTTAFDAAELAALTDALLAEGLSNAAIAQVMGGNTINFLRAQLPER